MQPPRQATHLRHEPAGGEVGSFVPQHYPVQPRHTWKPTSGEIVLVVSTGALSLLCCILCALQFVNHLKNWRSPGLQKCYLRIILVAPIYATFSWFAVLSSRNSGIFDLARSIYETYVLYAFFALVIIGAGGESHVKKYLRRNYEGNDVPIVCTLCPPCEEEGILSWKLFPLPSARASLMSWKSCLWQFMLLKPLSAVATSISEHLHIAIYTDPYIKPVALFSVTIAMLGLLNVYLALAKHPKVKQLKAEGKFLVIKLAIFLTVWQEMILHILVGKGVIHSPYCYVVGKRSTHCFDLTGFATPSAQRGVRTVATLVIFEMFALSFLMLYFFPYNDKCLGPLKKDKKAFHKPGNDEDLIDFDIFLRVLCFGDILCNLEDRSGGSYSPRRKAKLPKNDIGDADNTVAQGQGLSEGCDVGIKSPVMERGIS